MKFPSFDNPFIKIKFFSQFFHKFLVFSYPLWNSHIFKDPFAKVVLFVIFSRKLWSFDKNRTFIHNRFIKKLHYFCNCLTKFTFYSRSFNKICILYAIPWQNSQSFHEKNTFPWFFHGNRVFQQSLHDNIILPRISSFLPSFDKICMIPVILSWK